MSVTLGEVAFEVSDRIDAPAESDYDRFVGLEHFVSGEVKIQQWESTRSLVSAAKAFRKGDVLFARRNAYLRRASMVDFDGCCSGDAYVLRENNEVIVPGLLPFIVNSTSLWDFANSNAAGTMSKRVKWKDLANYEFLLPPKDQQAEIAELLWALDNSEEAIKLTHERTRIVRDSLFNQRLFISGSDVTEMSLNDVLVHVQYGISESLSETGDTPVLRMNNVSNGEVKLSDLKYFEFSADEEEKYLLNRGDILFNRTNSFELVGKSGLF